MKVVSFCILILESLYLLPGLTAELDLKGDSLNEKIKPELVDHTNTSDFRVTPKNKRRCFKCDPTDFNNYCRDFKPHLANLYDCENEHHPKTGPRNSPLNTTTDQKIPFSCFKIKADVAFGHGKIYGAKRYGCGHLVRVRNLQVTTTSMECRELKSVPVSGHSQKLNKEAFFDGIVCNCDNADGCNSAPRRVLASSLSAVFLVITLRNIL